MAQSPGRERARLAVLSQMAHNGWNNADLAERTGDGVDRPRSDKGTIGDFLSGNRWPKPKTRGRVEEALGWPFGTLDMIESGAEPPPLDPRSEPLPAGSVEQFYIRLGDSLGRYVSQWYMNHPPEHRDHAQSILERFCRENAFTAASGDESPDP